MYHQVVDCSGLRKMRRLTRWLLISVAMVFLFEAWLWDRLEPIFAAIVAHLPLETIRTRIAGWVERLSPAFSVVVFAVPFGLLLPFKIAGLWLLARGYWISAANTLIFAKLLGFGSTAFVYDAARAKLLQLNWFRFLHDRLIACKAWSHALVDPLAQEIKANLVLLMPHRVGRAIRLMLRIHTRERVRASIAGQAPRLD